MWADLVNDQLSPCGEPVSIARCVSESRGCRGCVPAARYTARLIEEGYEKAELQELLEARFDRSKKLALVIDEAPTKGALMAPVIIVEFSDFECPYCGKAHPLLKKLVQRFPDKVKVAFKHFPLSAHVNAMPAARAAVAAQRQSRFWEMADSLFDAQRELDPARIRELAERSGLDMTRFDRDFAADDVQERVERDKQEGRDLGVQGTPTLFINGRRYGEPLENLSRYIEEELAL